MKNIFESKKEDFEIKEYKVKIKDINNNDGHFYFNAKTKKTINLNKKKGEKMKTKKQILKHLKNKFPKNTFKFLDYFSSCGNFWHHVFLRDDKKIICTEQIYNNIEYGCDLSISYKNYNNLEEYMDDAENGFGYEWRNPNFNERIWRI